MTWHNPPQTFQKGHLNEVEYPLSSLPLVSDGAEMVMLGENLYEAPAPTMPGDDGFQAELDEVMRVRNDVLNGVWPTWFFQDHGMSATPPSTFKQVGVHVGDPEAAAGLVHMDDPMDLGVLMRNYLLGLIQRPEGQHGMFLENIPGFNAKLATAVNDALLAAAETKQFFGRPRPEEMLCFNMTHYPEGCPKHPAYPAGHGAAAGATFAVLESHFAAHLSSNLLEYVRDACLQFSIYRVLAGVHFADDCQIGFLLGYAAANGLASVTEAAEKAGWGERYVG